MSVRKSMPSLVNVLPAVTQSIVRKSTTAVHRSLKEFHEELAEGPLLFPLSGLMDVGLDALSGSHQRYRNHTRALNRDRFSPAK